MKIDKTYYKVLVEMKNDYVRFTKLLLNSAHLNKDKTELAYDNDTLKLLANSFAARDVEYRIAKLQFGQKKRANKMSDNSDKTGYDYVNVNKTEYDYLCDSAVTLERLYNVLERNSYVQLPQCSELEFDLDIGDEIKKVVPKHYAQWLSRAQFQAMGEL